MSASQKKSSVAKPAPRKKTARLEVRINAAQKAKIERAAELSGRKLTDFVIASIDEAASRVIRETTVIELSAQDSLIFAEALLNPPEPSAAFIRAMERYRRYVARENGRR